MKQQSQENNNGQRAADRRRSGDVADRKVVSLLRMFFRDDDVRNLRSFVARLNKGGFAEVVPEVQQQWNDQSEQNAAGVEAQDSELLAMLARRRRILKARRRKAAKKLSEFLLALSKCDSVAANVNLLFRKGRSLGIKNVRYHCLCRNNGRLVSIESAGHGDAIADRIRQGHILKKRVADGKPCDSFMCFDEGRPTVFEVHRAAQGIERADGLGGRLPHFRLQYDQCEPVLSPDEARIFVDFPLCVNGRCVGKLSCDLDVSSVAEIDPGKLLFFWRMAMIAAPHLRLSYDESIDEDIERIRQLLLGCDMDELGKILKGPEFRKFFGAEYSATFLDTVDGIDRKVLVLKWTNYKPIESFEQQKAYPRDKISYLAPYVAANKLSLRFEDLHDTELFEKQCRSQRIEGEICWIQDPCYRAPEIRVDETQVLHSNLTASIPGADGSSEGVIQLYNKVDNGGSVAKCFSDRDQRLLERATAEVIGPKIQTLKNLETTDRVIEPVFACAKAVEQIQSTPKMMDDIVEALKTMVPEGKSRKLYTVCFLTRKCVDRVMGGDLPTGDRNFRYCRRYRIGGALAVGSNLKIGGDLAEGAKLPDNPSKRRRKHKNRLGGIEYCLQEVMMHGRDAKKIGTDDVIWFECKGRDDWFTPNAICALACPFTVRNRPAGVIVVKSDSYDLLPERHGFLMTKLADHVGQVLESETSKSKGATTRGERKKPTDVKSRQGKRPRRNVKAPSMSKV
jgi:hypothetical protein